MKYIKKNWKKLALIAMVLVLDLVTKSIFDGKNINIIDGVFMFYSKHNNGGAWSILEGYVWLITLIGIIVLTTIIVFDIIMSEENKWYSVGMALIISGALGNLVDRLIFGYVRDFIYLEIINFPVFNIADVALNIGVVVFAIYVFFIPTKVEDPLLIKDVVVPEVSDADKDMLAIIKEQFKDEEFVDNKALRRAKLRERKVTKDNHWVRPKEEIAEDRVEIKDILEFSKISPLKVKPAKNAEKYVGLTSKKQKIKISREDIKAEIKKEIEQELRVEIRKELIGEIRDELIKEIGAGLKLSIDAKNEEAPKKQKQKR